MDDSANQKRFKELLKEIQSLSTLRVCEPIGIKINNKGSIEHNKLNIVNIAYCCGAGQVGTFLRDQLSVPVEQRKPATWNEGDWFVHGGIAEGEPLPELDIGRTWMILPGKDKDKPFKFLMVWRA